jgi:hypothetical protein
MTDTNSPETTPTPEKRVAYKFKYICKSKCKKLALEIAKNERPANRFSRVSEDFLVAAEAHLKNFIFDRIKRHPSNGKTLQ